jgi:hypothetical protein
VVTGAGEGCDAGAAFAFAVEFAFLLALLVGSTQAAQLRVSAIMMSGNVNRKFLIIFKVLYHWPVHTRSSHTRFNGERMITLKFYWTATIGFNVVRLFSRVRTRFEKPPQFSVSERENTESISSPQ